MTNDTLDKKLNEVFTGKVVRKDLLLQVKKGTNVPSFVLEFLLTLVRFNKDWLPFSRLFRRITFVRTRAIKHR